MKVNRCVGRNLLLGVCALLAGLASLAACARDCVAQVRDGWIRMPPGGMAMMAGFGRIENRCPAPVTIVAASSPAFADVSLHETRIVQGISRMRAVPELRLAPDGATVLKPGGLHLMLMRPSAPLKAGSKVAVQFELADGGVLLGEFTVQSAQGR